MAFVPRKDGEIYIEPIYKYQHKFATKKELLNRGFIRHVSGDLKEKELMGLCVIIADGFIRNFHNAKVLIDDSEFIRIQYGDIISILN